MLGGDYAPAGVHDGGVGACSTCHVMHNSESGPGPGSGSAYLLTESTASDLCLNCHASSSGSVLGGDPLTPFPEYGAGNFIFLLEDNLNDGPDGWTNPLGGHTAGHNIQAPGHGLASDGSWQVSPGGQFPAWQLGCTSCHDPHGTDNFRLLRGVGALPGTAAVFTYPAPEAVGLELGGPPEANDRHSAYRQGMSRWCANCHASYLNDHQGLGNFEHPTDEIMTGEILLQYNMYNGTADPQGGQLATAYLAPVPFEDRDNTTDRTFGASITSRLTCLTCHRAHASSGPRSGRWDFRVTQLGQDGVISGSYPLPNPYPDPAQDPLCYKCHSTGSD